MRLATMPVLVLVLTACSATQQRIDPIADCPPGGVVEIAMSDTASQYLWRGEALGIPQLETSLQNLAERCTVGELRLLQGARSASIADLIPLAMLGGELGIKVTYEDASGAVKPVQFVQ